MKTVKYTVKGLVQGIGFRPFVAECAEKLNISGWVRNSAGIVTVLARGEEERLALLKEQLKKGPQGSRVSDLLEEELSENVNSGFRIISSDRDYEENVGIMEFPIIPADLPTCDSCTKELKDKNNRRYRHPFISCTACGPRFSIIEEIPYDRETITMKKFDKCPICSKEYVSIGNVRRHAQTIACMDCGPVLTFWDGDKEIRDNTFALEEAIKRIKAGEIVAVKDIGGFHLVCRPDLEATVIKLRQAKNREEKPFALMFDNVEQIKGLCEVSGQEEEELLSDKRPIVLLKRRVDISTQVKQDGFSKKCEKIGLAYEVCKTSPYIGAMLPCNPVQIMLCEEMSPLIMTSANRSGDVMFTDNDEMLDWAKERNIKVLYHNRDILTALDDSIVSVVNGRRQVVRRARGMVPELIDIGEAYNKHNEYKGRILAFGSDLKSAFCLVNGGKAYVSQSFGDLESEAVKGIYERELARIKKLYDFRECARVIDKHPLYISSAMAGDMSGGTVYSLADTKMGETHNLSTEIYKVYHHYAHVASVMAEKHLKNNVLGIAFDGTGYGEDGSVWGSEFLLFKDGELSRVGHLKTMKLLGGDEASRNAMGSCYGYLANAALENVALANAAFDKARTTSLSDGLSALFELGIINKSQYQMVFKAIELNINVVESSSMGRLFDAVSALLGICSYNSYEGQAPIEMQYLAETVSDATAFEYKINVLKDENDIFIGDTENLMLQIIESMKDNVAVAKGKAVSEAAAVAESMDCCNIDNCHRFKARAARGFILAVADFIKEMCEFMRTEKVIDSDTAIALSGGTFLNRILTEKTIELLESSGFKVYINEEVPPSDAGLCLGQAYLSYDLR